MAAGRWGNETLKTITVDARMIRASGIGTVIANLIPRLMRRRPNWHFRLLGDTAALRAFPWAEEGRLSLVPFRAPIYSIREQAAWPVGATKGCDLIWVPHYNKWVSPSHP